MPKFRTAYSGQVRYETPTGTRIEKTYGYEVDNMGRRVLVQNGEKDIQDEINSYEEGCLIENIIERANMGDFSGFKGPGEFMDLTEFPKDLVEAKRSMMELENTFNSMSNDIKAKFNYSLEEFIATAGKDSWKEALGMNQGDEKMKTFEKPETTVELQKEVKE